MRNQILDAAALLFSERGYEGVSMRDISAVVQVSPANLYHHFRNKPDLIDATLAHVFEARGESLQLFLAEQADDQLSAFVHWLVEALTHDRVFARLLHQVLWDGKAVSIDRLSRTVLRKPFDSVVAAVAASGKPGPAETIALSIIAYILGQVLLLPLAAGLTGKAEQEPVEQMALRLLKVIHLSWELR